MNGGQGPVEGGQLGERREAAQTVGLLRFCACCPAAAAFQHNHNLIAFCIEAVIAVNGLVCSWHVQYW